MAESERVKMVAGEWYTCIDDELESLRMIARDAVFEHNLLPPRQRGNLGPALKALLGRAGPRS
ncbi:maltose acetyltransferase domain-containing protein, partial [Mesorhizobium sp. M7A.F.Ca.US.001.02.1.1]|uniref:maltose acetyltransferase domain-containing protein n=1 Tax=Mesorhizobium sp. M7A.F.Ca.US.001.02.1.1 TaxID=2496703 RepID=UPI000FD5C0E2